MFKIKSSSGETIITFNEKGDWEFSIDKTGYVDLLTQKDIRKGKVDGGKPIKRYATQDRAIEVVKDITKTIVSAQRGKGPKLYILPDE